MDKEPTVDSGLEDEEDCPDAYNDENVAFNTSNIPDPMEHLIGIFVAAPEPRPVPKYYQAKVTALLDFTENSDVQTQSARASVK